MSTNREATQAIRWCDDHLLLLDQRLLPKEVSYIACHDVDSVADAISSMVVRGAPAIGITAAYAVALSARSHFARLGGDWRSAVKADLAMLRATRPTAVNLMWALDVMAAACADLEGDPYAALLALALRLHDEDLAANRAMGDFGARLIAPGSGVLTHCNAGALATAGYGTALGVIRSAWRDGRIAAVYAGETRPWLQGARLTVWELMQDGIDATLIADSAAAWLMAEGRVQWVITGADRVAANGDTANKIGTYGLATLARAHGVRFMVAAPMSTVDIATASGADIVIEHREGRELTQLGGLEVAAPGVRALNPVFDVTPAHLIDALVTEKGVIERPDAASIAALCGA
ncbi:MAG: S-methyl-5-thioribose-1-phosphate isomerase [Proteobacteria bacterium]|nr:S-methyl-5-thioribose-1-phosphate isomerase [Pseudomonadota bacterium]